MSFYVYCHTNLLNNKKYFGITGQKTPEDRWGYQGRNYNKQHQPHFARAINKYGWDGFSHEIVAEGLKEDDAKMLEIDLIAKHKTTDPDFGYNISCGGNGNTKYSTEELKKAAITKHRAKGWAVRKYKLHTDTEAHTQALATRRAWYHQVKNDPEFKTRYQKYYKKAKQNYKQKLADNPELAEQAKERHAQLSKEKYLNDPQVRTARLEASKKQHAKVLEIKKALRKLYEENPNDFLAEDVMFFKGSKQSNSITKLLKVLDEYSAQIIQKGD